MKTVFTEFSRAFDAQYKTDDAASAVLYGFDSFALSVRAVNGERLARFLGLNVCLASLFLGGADEGIGVFCPTPQCLVTLSGERLNLQENTVAIENDVIERADYALYNYTLVLACAHQMLCYQDQAQAVQQLSFGLDTVLSRDHAVLSLKNVCNGYLADDFDRADALAQCLLLPKNRFRLSVNALFETYQINRNTFLPDKHLSGILDSLSHTFCAPAISALRRLKVLNYL